MDGPGVQKIIETAQEAILKTVERDGKLFATAELVPVLFDPHPEARKVGTLTAIRDYLAANVDALEKKEVMLHVENEGLVSLIRKIDGPLLQRDEYLQAEAEEPTFHFGEFMDPETFMIGLMTQFEQDGFDIEEVEKAAGNIREGKERTVADDGVSQEVTAKVGVQLGNVTLPSPVTLVPFRTFGEVEQPPSLFVFRARAGTEEQPPRLALFLADGNRWRLEAIKRVAEWLRKEIPEVTVLA